MRNREILHVDANSFFASVSLLYKPQLKQYPVAVGGSPESRHGIILAKNEHAKKYHIKTGMPIWQARNLCKDLIILPPEYHKYERFSKELKAIFSEYTDLQEPFGSDESWIDVTGSAGLYGDGMAIAEDIRKRVKTELGITVSIGVSWNKIFAKLGSDIKKPDAITAITKENYKEVVYPLPVNELLYVGPATARKLQSYYVRTIGDLAKTDEETLKTWFGKVGTALWLFANGLDNTPVSLESAVPHIKSVGNSSVAPRDLTTNEDIKRLIFILSESVGPRMREHSVAARTVEVWVCDNDMGYCTRQRALPLASNLNSELAKAAYQLFLDTYDWKKPIRKLGIRGSNLVFDKEPYQCSFYDNYNYEKRDKLEKLDGAVDGLNKRWPHSITRAITLEDSTLVDVQTKDEQRKFSPVSWY